MIINLNHSIVIFFSLRYLFTVDKLKEAFEWTEPVPFFRGEDIISDVDCKNRNNSNNSNNNNNKNNNNHNKRKANNDDEAFIT